MPVISMFFGIIIRPLLELELFAPLSQPVAFKSVRMGHGGVRHDILILDWWGLEESSL